MDHCLENPPNKYDDEAPAKASLLVFSSPSACGFQSIAMFTSRASFDGSSTSTVQAVGDLCFVGESVVMIRTQSVAVECISVESRAAFRNYILCRSNTGVSNRVCVPGQNVPS